MSPNQPPNSQFGDNPLNVAPPAPPTPWQGAPGGGNFNNWGPGEKNVYGGQQIAGATPSPADYQSVQQYSDAAHENARRYLDPQQDMQFKRFNQQLVNQGIDPNSPQGQQRQAAFGRQQADANNAAAFGAMQFGQGIQNQMSQQELANQQLAGNMQQALWNQQGQAENRDLQWGLGEMQNKTALAGQQNQYNLGMAGLDNQRYQADLGHQLGMGQLDYTRNMGEHSQMMDLLGYDMGVRQYNDQQQMLQDAMFNQWYGNTPIPGMNPVNPYDPANTMMNAGDTKWWSGGGGFSFSDRRLKENIVLAGVVNGVNLYHYNYIGDDVDRIGPMAQEVPHAAVRHPSGYLMVDMHRLF
jgi:hypothetical protein